MKHRWLIFLCAFALLVSLSFAACTGGDPEGEESGSISESEPEPELSSEPEPEPEPSSEPEEEDDDESSAPGTSSGNTSANAGGGGTTGSAGNTGGGGSGGGQSSTEDLQASHTVVCDPASYSRTAETITVKITNNGPGEGGYGFGYSIQRRVGDNWETIPLEFDTIDIAAILEPGQTGSETFSLHQKQYDYEAGTYRFVLGQLGHYITGTAEFTLT